MTGHPIWLLRDFEIVDPADRAAAGLMTLLRMETAAASAAKAADLLRDPRHVLHSAVTSPDSGEGEFKLHGSPPIRVAGLR